MKNEPILIECEGGKALGHDGLYGQVMCRMCGHWFYPSVDDLVPEHERDDIIARIERGDFDV